VCLPGDQGHTHTRLSIRHLYFVLLAELLSSPLLSSHAFLAAAAAALRASSFAANSAERTKRLGCSDQW
jgi:hypothetical protein